MAANPSSSAPPREGGAHEVSLNARTESKRERKRQLLADRLQQLSETFLRGRDSAYREQLQKIQLDTNLIMRIDPYTDRPLDALDSEHQQLLQNQHSDPNTSRSLLEMAGPKFQDWVHSIEDLVEERDYEIARQKDMYERKVQQHRNVHAFKVQTAKREHHSLSTTVRDRLMNTILGKKLRLSKEKEALEISDASALLLHPNQFSLTNPASPGGTHGKRATRLRREVEDIPGFSDSRKRKRNGNEDDGSPAPQRRAFDTSTTTPVWQGERERLQFRKTTGPVYSIDKLFTDRELTLNYQAASTAAHKYILRHKQNADSNGIVSSPSDNGSGDEKHEEEDGPESAPSAPLMERQSSHATRSTRGGAHPSTFYDSKLIGIEGLTNFDLPSNLDKLYAQEPKLPPIVPTPYNKAKPMSEANGPQALPQDDVQGDLMAMSILRQYEQLHGVGSNFDTGNGGRRVLEAVAYAPTDSKYITFVQAERPNPQDLRDGLGIPTSNIRGEPGAAGPSVLPPVVQAGAAATPMSRQSSLGGVAMSRQGTGGSTRGQRRRG